MPRTRGSVEKIPSRRFRRGSDSSALLSNAWWSSFGSTAICWQSRRMRARSIAAGHSEILAWIGKLSAGEKDDLFARLVIGEDSALPAEILHRFLDKWNGCAMQACDINNPRISDHSLLISPGAGFGIA